jgi:hypothetical protein
MKGDTMRRHSSAKPRFPVEWVFDRSWVQISARTPTILIVAFVRLPKSFQPNAMVEKVKLSL